MARHKKTVFMLLGVALFAASQSEACEKKITFEKKDNKFVEPRSGGLAEFFGNNKENQSNFNKMSPTGFESEEEKEQQNHSSFRQKYPQQPNSRQYQKKISWKRGPDGRVVQIIKKVKISNKSVNNRDRKKTNPYLNPDPDPEINLPEKIYNGVPSLESLHEIFGFQ